MRHFGQQSPEGYWNKNHDSRYHGQSVGKNRTVTGVVIVIAILLGMAYWFGTTVSNHTTHQQVEEIR